MGAKTKRNLQLLMTIPIHGLHWDLENLAAHELLFMLIRPFGNRFCSVAENRILASRSAIAMMWWMGG